MDLAGDGQPDLVVLDGPLPGLYEHDDERRLGPVPALHRAAQPRHGRPQPEVRRPRRRRPRRRADHRGRRLRLAPLAGGGGLRPGPPRQRRRSTRRKARGWSSPTATQSIYLADMSGDGLTDLVRIRNGEVCYWPNLGYGRFGAKVTMDNAPCVRQPGPVRPGAHPAGRHRRLAARPTSSTCTATACGSTSTSRATAGARRTSCRSSRSVDNLVDIQATDLLGNGTACLVWSSPLPGDARRPMRYVNLMGGREAAPAGQDGQQPRRRDARPLRALDQVLPAGQARRAGRGSPGCPSRCTWSSASRPTTTSAATASSPRYAYHHGYFDGEEREFRGFGMVEQWDTEEFAALTADGDAARRRRNVRTRPRTCRRCSPAPGSTPASTSAATTSPTSSPGCWTARTRASTTASRG